MRVPIHKRNYCKQSTYLLLRVQHHQPRAIQITIFQHVPCGPALSPVLVAWLPKPSASDDEPEWEGESLRDNSDEDDELDVKRLAFLGRR